MGKLLVLKWGSFLKIVSFVCVCLFFAFQSFAGQDDFQDQLERAKNAYNECVNQLPAKVRQGLNDNSQRGRRSWSGRTQKRVTKCVELRRYRDDIRATIMLGDDLKALYKELSGADRRVMEKEADGLASYLVGKTTELNKQYKMGGSALWHNFLVKVGSKEGGYCYHWAEELFKGMGRTKLRFFERAWGVHHKARATENNAVIVVGRGKSIQEGIVYDPWRGRGEPYWRKVKDDSQTWNRLFSEDEILYGQVIPSY